MSLYNYYISPTTERKFVMLKPSIVELKTIDIAPRFTPLIAKKVCKHLVLEEVTQKYKP